MNLEEYVKDEFKNGEKRMDKIENKLDLIQIEIREIHIALKVDEKLRAIKARNSAILYSGITSLIIGLILHFAKGMMV